jgi:hypothetical protein
VQTSRHATRWRLLFPTRRALATALFVCVVAPAVLIGLQIHDNRKLSPVDEAQHLDYVDRVADGEIPRQGQRLKQSTLRTAACRGIAIADIKVPPCGQAVLRGADFPGGGSQYEAQQPPTYYAVAVPLRWVMQNILRIRDHLDATRAVSAVWLIVGLLLLWCAGRLMDVSPAALGACLLVLVTAPSIVFYHATVSNDATAVTGAGVVAFAAASAHRRPHRATPIWLFAAGFFAAACKSTNVLPAAAVSALFAVAALHGRGREEPWTAAGRRWLRDGGALLAGGLVATLVWVYAHGALALIDSKDEPAFAALRRIPHGFDVIVRGAATLFHPVSEELAVALASPSTLNRPVQDALGAALSYLLIGGALTGLFVSRRRWSHVLGLIAVPTLYLGGVALGVAIVRTYAMTPGLSGRYGMSMAPLLAVVLADSLDRGWPVKVVGLFGAVAFVTTLAVLVT